MAPLLAPSLGTTVEEYQRYVEVYQIYCESVEKIRAAKLRRKRERTAPDTKTAPKNQAVEVLGPDPKGKGRMSPVDAGAGPAGLHPSGGAPAGPVSGRNKRHNKTRAAKRRARAEAKKARRSEKAEPTRPSPSKLRRKAARKAKFASKGADTVVVRAAASNPGVGPVVSRPTGTAKASAASSKATSVAGGSTKGPASSGLPAVGFAQTGASEMKLSAKERKAGELKARRVEQAREDRAAAERVAEACKGLPADGPHRGHWRVVHPTLRPTGTVNQVVDLTTCNGYQGILCEQCDTCRRIRSTKNGRSKYQSSVFFSKMTVKEALAKL